MGLFGKRKTDENVEKNFKAFMEIAKGRKEFVEMQFSKNESTLESIGKKMGLSINEFKAYSFISMTMNNDSSFPEEFAVDLIKSFYEISDKKAGDIFRLAKANIK